MDTDGENSIGEPVQPESLDAAPHSKTDHSAVMMESGHPHVSPKERMAEQVRKLVAYVGQAGTLEDLEQIVCGIDPKKIDALLDKSGDDVPFELAYSLDSLAENVREVKDARKKIAATIQHLSEKELPHIEQWVKAYREKHGLSEDQVVEQGRASTIEILVDLFRSKRKFSAHERIAVENMAQNITSKDVMEAIMPFATKDPWIAIHLLNNLALVDPKERIKGLETVNFMPALQCLLDFCQESGDSEIIKRTAKILQNPFIQHVVEHEGIKRVIDQVLPGKDNHDLWAALMYYPGFNAGDALRYLDKIKLSHDLALKTGVVMELSMWLERRLAEMARSCVIGGNTITLPEESRVGDMEEVQKTLEKQNGLRMFKGRIEAMLKALRDHDLLEEWLKNDARAKLAQHSHEADSPGKGESYLLREKRVEQAHDNENARKIRDDNEKRGQAIKEERTVSGYRAGEKKPSKPGKVWARRLHPVHEAKTTPPKHHHIGIVGKKGKRQKEIERLKANAAAKKKRRSRGD